MKHTVNARCIEFAVKEVAIDERRDYIEIFEKGEAMSVSPYDLHNPMDAMCDVKCKVYERVTLKKEGCPDHLLYVNRDDIEYAVPMIKDIITKETQRNVTKITQQEFEISRLKKAKKSLKESNKFFLNQIEEFKKPWYKKIWDTKRERL